MGGRDFLRLLQRSALALALVAAGCGLKPSAINKNTASRPVIHAMATQAPEAITPPLPREAEARAQPRQPRIQRTASGIVAYAGSAIPAEVRTAHLRQVARMRCDSSYPQEYDSWHRIDLDGDGQDEYLAFITLEGFGGGNNYVRYLIIYRYVSPVWFAAQVLPIGGKGSAGVGGDVVRLDDGVFSTDAEFYGPDDPMCCPTQEATIRMRVGSDVQLHPAMSAPNDDFQGMQDLLGFVAHCD